MKFFKNKKTSLNKSQFYTENSKHNIKTPAIRLFYVAFEPFVGYDNGLWKLGQTFDISSPFKLPDRMSVQDACKVVSYLFDFVEKGFQLEPASEQTMILVSSILEDYGFKKTETKNKGSFHWDSYYDFQKIISADLSPCRKIKDVVDLFSVDGDFDTFKKSDLFDRYFDWYTEGITEQEVADIYRNVNKTEELGFEK